MIQENNKARNRRLPAISAVNLRDSQQNFRKNHAAKISRLWLAKLPSTSILFAEAVCVRTGNCSQHDASSASISELLFVLRKHWYTLLSCLYGSRWREWGREGRRAEEGREVVVW